jgi:hypothetical protein
MCIGRHDDIWRLVSSRVVEVCRQLEFVWYDRLDMGREGKVSEALCEEKIASKAARGARYIKESHSLTQFAPQPLT